MFWWPANNIFTFQYLFLHVLRGPPLHMFDEVLIEVRGQRGCEGTCCSAWGWASRYWTRGHRSADYTWSLTTTATAIITAAVTAHVVRSWRWTSLTAANHKQRMGQCLSKKFFKRKSTLLASGLYKYIHFNVILEHQKQHYHKQPEDGSQPPQNKPL